MSANNYVKRYQRPSLKDAIASVAEFVDRIHPACLALPGIGPEDFDNMVDSIREDELHDSIIVSRDRQLIDGRCRVQACLVAGFEITSDKVVVTEKSAEAIAQTNVARRHLTADQKIMDAAMRAENAKAESRRKQTKSLKKGQKHRESSVVDDLSTTENASKRKIRTNERIAKEQGVPVAKVNAASRLLRDAPEKADAVSKGETPLNQALAETGLAAKPSRKPKPTTAKIDKKSSVNAMKNLRFEDRGHNVLMAQGKGVSIFYGSQSKRELVVCRVNDDWWMLQTINGEPGQLTQYATREEAELAAECSV